MLVSTNWISQWVDHGLDEQELAARLTMAGLEVKSITPVNKTYDGVLVGRVDRIDIHPEKENLKICTVAVGSSRTLQIVCGAPNVSNGHNYPVATVGTVMEDDRKIEEFSILGVTSQGILCSEKELGLGEVSTGLMELDSAATLGCSLNDYFELEDSVFDIELTPNRADCLSVQGVAREVSILSEKTLQIPKIKEVTEDISSNIEIQIDEPKDCPVYCGRLIEQIDLDAITPDWMRQHLQKSGLRCLHPIVDITNFVMLELGQPMHAFDPAIFDSSRIIVRHSVAGEKLVLLDGKELDLVEGSLLIASPSGPIGLAGVMGGESSGIRKETRNVFLEAAFFTPRAIRFSVSNYGLHTDASHRFERGVDPQFQRTAIARATELILEIAGGVAGPMQEIHDSRSVPEKHFCRVREARVARVLGAEISSDAIDSILRRVNREVKVAEDGWDVLPYSFRFDLEKEHDQIEEIARIYGYDRIPSSMCFGGERPQRINELTIRESLVRNTLHSAGYHEAITYSFVDPELQRKITPQTPGKLLANPIAENLSVMRTTLWPGLIGAYVENHRRGQERICLYEIGCVFHPDSEKNVLGGLAFGKSACLQWGLEDRNVDFFDLKGDLQKVLDLSGTGESFEFVAESIDGLHPGCSAGIYQNQQRIGTTGQVHPEILKDYRIAEAVFVFEVSMLALASRDEFKYSETSHFPSVVRDISFLISKDIPISDVTRIIKLNAGEFLENLNLFDVYSGAGIDIDNKSVAYRLTFRLQSRTLTDAEVDSRIEIILNALHAQLCAQLRK